MSPSHPHASKDAPLTVRESNSDWTAATVANVMITIMWKRGTADQMRRLRQIHDEWYRAHPQGIATFNVVFPSTLIPEADARQYIAGAVLLGVAPCTAMVFVWSQLTRNACRRAAQRSVRRVTTCRDIQATARATATSSRTRTRMIGS